MIAHQCTFFFFVSVATVIAGSGSTPSPTFSPKNHCWGDDLYHTFDEVANYNATTGTLSAPGFIEPLTLPGDVDWSTFEITARNESAVATVKQFDTSTKTWTSKSFVSGTKRVFNLKGADMRDPHPWNPINWTTIETLLTEGQPGMIVAVENLSTLTVSNGQRTFTARPLLWDPAHQTQYVMFTSPVQVELSFHDAINDLKIGAVNYGKHEQVWVAQNYFPNPLFPGDSDFEAFPIPLNDDGFVTRGCDGVYGFGQGLPIERCVQICSGIYPVE